MPLLRPRRLEVMLRQDGLSGELGRMLLLSAGRPPAVLVGRIPGRLSIFVLVLDDKDELVWVMPEGLFDAIGDFSPLDRREPLNAPGWGAAWRQRQFPNRGRPGPGWEVVAEGPSGAVVVVDCPGSIASRVVNTFQMLRRMRRRQDSCPALMWGEFDAAPPGTWLAVEAEAGAEAMRLTPVWTARSSGKVGVGIAVIVTLGIGLNIAIGAVVDHDGDGYLQSTIGADCDDHDPKTFPGAPEICDGSDNDCDGEGEFTDSEVAFTWIRAWPDMDQDWYGDGTTSSRWACRDQGLIGRSRPRGDDPSIYLADNGDDCFDQDTRRTDQVSGGPHHGLPSAFHPGIPDGISVSGDTRKNNLDSLDNDCDWEVDEDASVHRTEVGQRVNDNDRAAYLQVEHGRLIATAAAAPSSLPPSYRLPFPFPGDLSDVRGATASIEAPTPRCNATLEEDGLSKGAKTSFDGRRTYVLRMPIECEDGQTTSVRITGKSSDHRCTLVLDKAAPAESSFLCLPIKPDRVAPSP